MNRHQISIRILPIALALWTVSAALAASPTTQTSTWTNGGGNSNWNTASNWSPSGIPNNGNNGISGYSVLIGSPSPATLNISPTIDSLIVNSNGLLNTSQGNLLRVVNNLNNSGTIAMQGGITVLGSGNNDGTITVTNAKLTFGSSFINNHLITLSGDSQLTAISTTLTNNGIITIGGLESALSSGATLINEGTLSTVGSLTQIQCNGSITNDGTLDADGSATEILITGTLTNLSGTILTGGTYEVNASGAMYLPGTITTNAANVIFNNAPAGNLPAIAPFAINSGSFTLQNGTTFTTVGNLTNSGTLLVGPAANGDSASSLTITGNYTQTAGFTQIDGTLTTTSNGTITLSGGTLKGTGSINAPLINTGGTLSPGDSPGQLSLTGNYSQSPAATFAVLLGGYTPAADFSLLTITGSASLAGLMEVDLINGFAPKIGDQFTFLTTTQGITGAFDTFTSNNGLFTFAVDYGANSNLVEITVTSVPEPCAFMILMLATLALPRRRRRRMVHFQLDIFGQ
jgi:hypothetical protein